VTIPGGDKYGAIDWLLKPHIVTQAVPGGYTASVQGLDVIIRKAEIATRVKVKGEPKARFRTDKQIAATLEHERDLHKEIGRSFDKNNQNRKFNDVYRSVNEAFERVSDQMKKSFDDAQKHDDRFKEVMKRESFR
jgi:hypothetical protein